MNKPVYYLALAIIFILVGWFANTAYHLPKSPGNPISQVKPRPFEKYSIENLAQADIKSARIEIGNTIKEDKDFTSYEFSFSLDPSLSGKEKKKVTGQINIPKGNGPFPVIIMFRGYVDQKEYKTGDGTRKAAEVFAGNGFITIAPDFLGYGGSDKEAENIFESRFQTYITAATILKSIDSIERWDKKSIFIWGHSNGGQVAITVLEITGVDYPTVLWAPVAKPFPYSILYYTDESDDRGKLIRRELAKFEEDYDVEKYSLANYFDRIKAPIQLNQGTADDAVPFYWSDSLAKTLKKDEVETAYIKYPGSDHNLQPAWNQVVQNNLAFYRKHLTNQ